LAETKLSPATGPVGTAVTISGANFGSSQGTSKVTFNGSQTNLAALDSLMAEWSRAGVPFLTRIAHLKGTQAGGLNGIYKLTTTTVTADGGGSTLTGNSSGGDTWFIAPTTDTVASKTGDVVDTF